MSKPNYNSSLKYCIYFGQEVQRDSVWKLKDFDQKKNEDSAKKYLAGMCWTALGDAEDEIRICRSKGKLQDVQTIFGRGWREYGTKGYADKATQEDKNALAEIIMKNCDYVELSDETEEDK